MAYHKIKKVLIANRGEIALRIQRTCQRLNLACAITISDADKGSSFSRFAEEQAFIGGMSAKDSYLSIPKMIEAAKRHACNAVHPGYGFLSEQPNFAEAVQNAGLVFIGPSPECMRKLGDKLLARKQATLSKVPHLKGIEDSGSEDTLLNKAKAIGYPILIKAAAGGGGRGMRVVYKPEQLLDSAKTARSEAEKFFSDGRIYLERYLEKPRHIEVQVFGDNHGNIIHLGTRDCSTQRRHQKLIEEAPASSIPQSLREKIQKAAVKLATSVNYNNAGTAEFLVQDNEFFFLEMNTRIQVEHPATEAICGLDLIELQIRVAEGEELPLVQKEVNLSGHAIEFRIYAEDPKDNFKPTVGIIEQIDRPTLDYLREDWGLNSGDKVSPYYDAMLSKLIVVGATREQALARSKTALEKYKVTGLATTLEFHRWIIKRKEFKAAAVDIGFIEREFLPVARQLTDSNPKDKNFLSPIEGMNVKQNFFYEANISGFQYNIELLHLSDGTFVAIPLNQLGSRAQEKYCRRAQLIDLALRSLREEVLESVRPEDIF